MKFITKEFYEIAQVKSYLNYDLDDELSLEERANLSKELGLDYDAIDRENFANIRQYLLKYLPDSLKYSVYDESIMNSNKPSVDFLDKIEEWKGSNSSYRDWYYAFKAYNQHYKRIEKQLPKRMKREIKKHDFHDARIVSVDKSRSDRLIIELDSYFTKGKCFVNFNGIKQIEMPEGIVGYWWLYDEVYLSSSGNFDFQVLLDSCITDKYLDLHEFRVIADEFFIKRK